MRILISAPRIALLVAAATCASPVDAQRSTGLPGDTLNFPAPDRPVSSIVAARWTDENIRDRFGEAARVISYAGIRAGMTVADIGAGDGYYVVRLAKAVGPKGRVIGEDIMPDYLDKLRARIQSEQLRNVDVIHGTPDDPKLPERGVDAAFMIHMYHEVTRPYELLWHLSRSLKPGGIVIILDQDGPTDRHGTPPALLRCELQILGYEQKKKTTLDDGAYVAVFRAPDAPLSPATVRSRLTEKACKQGR
ncbi:MAG: class I SAM-dependent methyltransferase [Gemmatimonas sp.]